MNLDKHDWALLAGLIFIAIPGFVWVYWQFMWMSFVAMGWTMGLGTSLIAYWIVAQNQHRKIGKPLREMGK